MTFDALAGEVQSRFWGKPPILDLYEYSLVPATVHAQHQSGDVQPDTREPSQVDADCLLRGLVMVRV